jgi:hypothetical protein
MRATTIKALVLVPKTRLNARVLASETREHPPVAVHCPSAIAETSLPACNDSRASFDAFLQHGRSIRNATWFYHCADTVDG